MKFMQIQETGLDQSRYLSIYVYNKGVYSVACRDTQLVSDILATNDYDWSLCYTNYKYSYLKPGTCMRMQYMTGSHGI